MSANDGREEPHDTEPGEPDSVRETVIDEAPRGATTRIDEPMGAGPTKLGIGDLDPHELASPITLDEPPTTGVARTLPPEAGAPSSRGRNTISDTEDVPPASVPAASVPADSLGRASFEDVAADGEADPVQIEDDAAGPVGEHGKRKRRNWIFWALGGLFVTALVGPLLFYFLVWRYRPTAPHHIPAGTTIAVRFDGRELYLYEPFRKNILGSFDGSASAKGRSDRFKKHTGIDLRNDVREVIFATMTADSWIVLIGGNFETGRTKTKFVTGLRDFLAEEGVQGWTLSNGVLKGPVLRIAQAEDTTILIANNDEILRAAMEPSDSWKDLGLASSGAMSFVVDRGAFEAAGKAAPNKIPALALLAAPDAVTHVADACRHTQRMTGYLELGRDSKINIDAVPTSDSSASGLTTDLEAVRADAKALAPFMPEQDTGGLKEALLDAKIKPRAKTVMVTVPWSKKEIDGGLERLGAKIREVFGE